MSDAPGEPQIHPLIRLYAWLMLLGLPGAPAFIALRGAGGRLSVDTVSLQLTGHHLGWAAPIGFALALGALAWLAHGTSAGPVRIAGLGPLCLLGYAILIALAGTFVFAPGGLSRTPLAARIYVCLRDAGFNALLVLAGGVPYLLASVPWRRLHAERPGQVSALAFYLLWAYTAASLFKLLLGS